MTQNEIYLCQAGPALSCGACCGLYNVADPGRESVFAMLLDRTASFSQTPRTVDAICEFAKQNNPAPPEKRPFPHFHHCPFVGLIGKNRIRAGCLLHPEAAGNKGIDYRGLSYYGGMACRDYFCPSHRRLLPVIVKMVNATVTDWYLYGLIITEADLLLAFYKEIQQRTKRPLLAEDFVNRPQALSKFRELLELKIHWPFRKNRKNGFVNYFFEDGRYPLPPIDYESLQAPVSPYDAIFQALGSAFESLEHLRCAENRIDKILSEVVECIRQSIDPKPEATPEIGKEIPVRGT